MSLSPTVSPPLKGAIPIAPAPIELRLTLWFGLIFVLGLALGLPLNVPDANSVAFIHKHYFGPLFLAFALNIPIVWAAGRRRDGDPFLLLRMAPFLALVMLIHFNFKAWMPLINPISCDEAYQRLDEICWPVVWAFCALRTAIAGALPFAVDHAYHSLFVGMFFVAFAAHALGDSPARQRQLVLGLCWILLAGGVCYWVAPALGPFLYRPGLNAESVEAQRHMLSLFQSVVATRQIPEGYFTAPLAAMPSLHVAHALFFTLFARRSLRPLFWLFLPLTGWIVIESVASGWHYLIDLPVGALLALIALRLTRRWVPEAPPTPTPTAAVPVGAV